MADIIQIRRDTAANWTEANPLLAQGEMGLETDTLNLKFGDGLRNWNDLPYYRTEGSNIHNDLNGRDASDAHPISAITGLQEKLDSIEVGANIFMGAFATWAVVPSTYAEGAKVPDSNDYMVVLDSNDYSTTNPIKGPYYYIYEGEWNTAGKNGWKPKFKLGQTYTAGTNVSISEANVISAVDTTYTAGTGIDITDGVISNTQTSAEWGKITGTLSSQTDLQEALNGKQDAGDYALTSELNDLADRVDDIEDLIPDQASTTNQLADKNFVNSSIQTATANFRGNWEKWENVPSNAALYPADYKSSTTPTVNDYLVVVDASTYNSSSGKIELTVNNDNTLYHWTQNGQEHEGSYNIGNEYNIGDNDEIKFKVELDSDNYPKCVVTANTKVLYEGVIKNGGEVLFEDNIGTIELVIYTDLLEGTWRFKYTGDWDTVGKNGWFAEYQVNETPFTSEQLAALNSGITKETVDSFGDIITYDASDFLSSDTVIPTKTSDLTNDSGFITSDYHDDSKQDVTDNSLATTSKTVVGAINELNSAVNAIKLSKFPNAVIIGDLTINHGQTTGFSQTSYLALPFVFNTQNKGFEFHYAFKTNATDVTTPQNLFGSKFCIASYISGGKLRVRVSSNGTSWDALDIETNLDIQPNTTYYIKLESNLLSYTVSASTDGVTYNQIGYKVTTAQPKHGDVFIGIGNNNNNPFLGMIDLNYWWLKIAGETIWEGMGESGLSTRADISLSNLDEDGEARFAAKQDVLTPGTGITIIDNVISSTGGEKEIAVSTEEPTEESVEVWINPEGEGFDINSKQDKLIAGYGINITNYPKILPEGYTQLEYVESNATQFVDTGVIYNSGDNMKIVWTFTDMGEWNTNQSLFGAVTNDMNHPTDVPYGILGIDMLRSNLYISGCTSQVPLYGVNDGKKHSFEIINQNRPLLDGKSIWQGWDVTFNNTYGPLASASTVALFGCHRNSLNNPEVLDIVSTCHTRIYEFEIENKCKLIPTKDPDGVVGFYDVLRNIFITTDRGDDLIAGGELLNNVISSTINGDSNPMGGVEATPAYTLPEGYQAIQYIQNTGVEMFELPEDFYLGSSIYSLQFDFRDTGSTTQTGSLIGKRLTNDLGLYRVQREPENKFHLTETARDGVGTYNVNQTLYNVAHGGSPSYDTLPQHRIDYLGVGQVAWDYSKIYRNEYTPTQTRNLGKMGLFGIIDETSENTYVPITTLYRIYRYVQKDSSGKIVTFLIPVRNQEGIVGMFDLVSQQFLDSVTGTNNFIAGPDIDYNNGINIGSYVFYDGPDLTATPDKKGYIKVNIDWNNSHGLSNRTAFNSGVTGTLYEKRSSSGTTGGKHNFSYQTVIGYTAEGGATGSTAYGYNSIASHANTTAVGYSAQAKAQYSTAIGASAVAQTYNYTTAIGYNAVAQQSAAVAIGPQTKALGGYSIAIGNTQATASGTYSIAIGTNAVTNSGAQYSIQLGIGTCTTANKLQVWNWELLDKNTGKIPSERIDFPETATALSELTDVSLSALTNGQSLVYNNGVWSNAKAGVDVSYDSTNKRLKFA